MNAMAQQRGEPTVWLFILLAVALVVLIVNRRTRVVGCVILAVLALLGGGYFFARSAPRDQQAAVSAPEAAFQPNVSRNRAKPRGPNRSTDKTTPAAPHPPEPSASDEIVETPDDLSADPKMPKWVTAEDEILPDRTLVTKLKIGPYSTPAECVAKLDAELIKATNDFILMRFEQNRYVVRDWLSLPLDYIQTHIRREQYLHQQQREYGETSTLYVRLTFTPQVQKRIDELYKDAVVELRLMIAAVAAGAVLSVLGIFWGYFQLDTATRGYYTWSLRAAAVALLAAVGAAAALWIDYLD